MQKYKIQVLVDKDLLIKAYTGNNQSIKEEELPSVEEMLDHELDVLSFCGIYLVGEIEEAVSHSSTELCAEK